MLTLLTLAAIVEVVSMDMTEADVSLFMGCGSYSVDPNWLSIEMVANELVIVEAVRPLSWPSLLPLTTT